MKLEVHAFRPIPLPLPEMRVPTGTELPLVRRMNERLLAYDHPVTWACEHPGEQNCSPLVWIMFSGGLEIDELWCRFFRAELVTSERSSWIARPAFLEPDAPAVCLLPLHDRIDLETAVGWASRSHSDPIVRTTVGFLGVQPQRVFTFTHQAVH
jgi:hypothetical protein